MCMGTATLAGSISALIIIIINLSIDNTRKYSRYYAVNWEHTTCAKCSFSFSMSNVLIIHKLIDIWILCREFCYFSFVIGNVRKEQKKQITFAYTSWNDNARSHTYKCLACQNDFCCFIFGQLNKITIEWTTERNTNTHTHIHCCADQNSEAFTLAQKKRRKRAWVAKKPRAHITHSI